MTLDSSSSGGSSSKRISRSFHSCLRGSNSPEEEDGDDHGELWPSESDSDQ
jgi:hypothetical protein